MKRVVVIGAGIGGLATAAVLARAGLQVTVLEAHIYPGGCAGTFYHQGYRFDAGATLAGGFYPGGPMELLGRAAGVSDWGARPAEPSMIVHLPGGRQVARWGDERRRAAHLEAFGEAGEAFWRWQEATAEAAWRLSLRLPPWPPQSPSQLGALLRDGLAWLGQDAPARLLPGLLRDALRPAAARLAGAPARLRLFVDAQLLISAQATSLEANALYAAAALDLPRRSVVHLEGGMGAIAERLAEAVRQGSGKTLFRHEATRIVMRRGGPAAVETRRGEFEAEAVVANLTPWDAARLLGEAAPLRLRRLPPRPRRGWGAFIVYLGVDASAIPPGFPLHHQALLGEPLGEGRSVFLSISPEWDGRRAPAGKRAITLSTHTALAPWWELYEKDRPGYEARKQRYLEQVLETVATAIPALGGLRQAADLILPGTPVTFARFTRRAWGWVGGFPQVNLWQCWGPRLGQGLWLVGDSIFPGQSAAAAALGGLRVASDVQTALTGIEPEGLGNL
ncbi:MAG: FAD-dependent oxidoreductase [Anaerolineales bacterium]|nr:FAD-dependent oxidoreductase [Anaerolineales bacterium]